MQKSVLITGCSSGIGREAANVLQARGYTVIAACRKLEDLEAVKLAGIKYTVPLDLTCSQSIINAVEATLAITGGGLYGLFNNAAFGIPGAVEDLSAAALRCQFETNVFGTHELTRLLLPAMLGMDDARIVQNSSVLGFAPMPFRGAYVASKFALEGLTDTLRLELQGTSVKVCLIEPGPIVSNFRNNALAAFKTHVDYKNSRHAAMYQKSLARLSSKKTTTPFTLPASAVVTQLIHGLESKRPKPRYYVTVPTYILGTLKRLLSTRMLDRFIRRFGRA